MAQERADGGLIKIDDAILPTRRLDRADLRGMAELDDLAADGEAGPLRVDVLPLQPEKLTAPQAGERRDLEQGTERVGGTVVEEGAEVGGFPWLHMRSSHLG